MAFESAGPHDVGARRIPQLTPSTTYTATHPSSPPRGPRSSSPNITPSSAGPSDAPTIHILPLLDRLGRSLDRHQTVHLSKRDWAREALFLQHVPHGIVGAGCAAEWPVEERDEAEKEGEKDRIERVRQRVRDKYVEGRPSPWRFGLMCLSVHRPLRQAEAFPGVKLASATEAPTPKLKPDDQLIWDIIRIKGDLPLDEAEAARWIAEHRAARNERRTALGRKIKVSEEGGAEEGERKASKAKRRKIAPKEPVEEHEQAQQPDTSTGITSKHANQAPANPPVAPARITLLAATALGGVKATISATRTIKHKQPSLLDAGGAVGWVSDKGSASTVASMDKGGKGEKAQKRAGRVADEAPVGEDGGAANLPDKADGDAQLEGDGPATHEKDEQPDNQTLKAPLPIADGPGLDDDSGALQPTSQATPEWPIGRIGSAHPIVQSQAGKQVGAVAAQSSIPGIPPPSFDPAIIRSSTPKEQQIPPAAPALDDTTVTTHQDARGNNAEETAPSQRARMRRLLLDSDSEQEDDDAAPARASAAVPGRLTLQSQASTSAPIASSFADRTEERVSERTGQAERDLLGALAGDVDEDMD